MPRFDWQSLPAGATTRLLVAKLNDRLRRLGSVLSGFNRVEGGTFFEGQFLELEELDADPDAPAANRVRLYAKDNGAGKTGLYARFNTGAVQQVAVEP